MRRPTNTSPFYWSTMLHRSLAGLAMSFAAIGVLGTAAVKAEPVVQPASLPNGVYLYGQAPEPDQLNTGYFVFEVNNGDVIGALYMPSSSFDCASGKLTDSKLALTVRDSYDRSTNPYEIALERTAQVATAGNATVKPTGLDGFYPLEQVSANDLRILNVCKADLKK